MKGISLAAIGLLALAFIGCKKDVSPNNNPTESLGRSGGIRAKAAATSTTGSGGTQTAQSVMISYNGATEIIIVDNQVWHFDATAAAMANPAWSSCPLATSGRGNGNACRSQLVNDAQQNRCYYWNQEGHPYWVLKQQLTVGDINAAFNFSVDLAGESYMKGGGFKDGKYSFTLGNTDSTSRISNLVYSIDGAPAIPLAHTIIKGTAANNLGSFQYACTGQKFGNSAVFSALIDGTFADILASDGTSNNDGANMWAFTAVGKSETVVLSLPPGNHTVTVSGSIKENEGVASWTFSKTQNIHISAEGCSQ